LNSCGEPLDDLETEDKGKWKGKQRKTSFSLTLIVAQKESGMCGREISSSIFFSSTKASMGVAFFGVLDTWLVGSF
jgi:hypothetical protein